MENRYDFVYLADVTNGNPNGDPDRDNAPRIDPRTKRGLISDVCVKRKIRNYVDRTRQGQPGMEIYVRERAILNCQHDKAWEAIQPEAKPAERKKLPKDVAKARELTDWMRANFFDIRTFGAVMTTGVNCGQVRGALQFTFGRSADPVDVLNVSLTRMAVTTEKDAEAQGDNRTMGRKHIVPYGLYRFHGFITPSDGFTQDDLDLTWEALRNMWDLDRSAARGEMAARRLVAFRHESRYGNAPAADLLTRVSAVKCADVEYPRAFGDYEVAVDADGLPAGVEILDLL